MIILLRNCIVHCASAAKVYVGPDKLGSDLNLACFCLCLLGDCTDVMHMCCQTLPRYSVAAGEASASPSDAPAAASEFPADAPASSSDDPAAAPAASVHALAGAASEISGDSPAASVRAPAGA